MAKMYGKGKTAIESEDQARLRFQVELEFVQCLANPNYLNFLAQRGYFKDQTFINYLKYLLYWKEPEYAKYLTYPMCLYFLDMLQYEHFRREIVNSQCAKFIDDQIILMWQHYTRKRIKLIDSVNGVSNVNGVTVKQEEDLTNAPPNVANTNDFPTQQSNHLQEHNNQYPPSQGQLIQNGVGMQPHLATTQQQQNVMNGISGYGNNNNANMLHRT